MRSLGLFLLAQATFQLHNSHHVQAIKLDLVGRSVHPSRAITRLARRAGITGESVNTSNGSVPVANTQNAEYIANINLGGKTIPVVIDTGRFVSPYCLFAMINVY